MSNSFMTCGSARIDAVIRVSDVFAGWLQVAQHRHALADTLEASMMVHGMAAWAMARKCSTALVDPPKYDDHGAPDGFAR